MDEKKLEELSLKMAETHGVTQADAASMIKSAMRSFGDIRDAIIAIGQALSSVMATNWEPLRDYNERTEERHSNRRAWLTIRDTRKQSQVTSNKPRFMVRKIIR